MPAGRPSDYKPEFCDLVIAAGEEGKGKAEMARECDVHYATFNRWEHEHPEFREAVKEAVRRSQAWWESRGRLATFGGVQGFNATSFIFNMKNRFPEDWRDRHDVDLTSKGGSVAPLDWSKVPTEALEAIRAAMEKGEK